MKRVFVLFVFFTQCMTGAAQPGSSEIEGEYYLRGVMETASGLRLNADSSFEFFYSYGALDRQGKGKWQLQKNLIILNSSPKPKSDFAIIKSEEIKGDSIFVKITDNNSMVLRYVKCNFQIGNQVISANTDASGRVSIPQTKFDSLELIFTICPDRPSVFVDLNKNHNYFEFRFEKWICEVVFKDLKLRIDKNGLTGQHPLLPGDNFSYIKNLP